MAQEYSLNRTSVRHDESLHRKRATIFVVPLAGIPAHRISAWPLSGAWRLEGGGGSCRTFRAIAPREEGGEVSLRIWRGHGVVFRAGAPAEAGRVAAFSLTFVLSFSNTASPPRDRRRFPLQGNSLPPPWHLTTLPPSHRRSPRWRTPTMTITLRRSIRWRHSTRREEGVAANKGLLPAICEGVVSHDYSYLPSPQTFPALPPAFALCHFWLEPPVIAAAPPPSPTPHFPPACPPRVLPTSSAGPPIRRLCRPPPPPFHLAS